jgi:zinc ribbon protein
MGEPEYGYVAACYASAKPDQSEHAMKPCRQCRKEISEQAVFCPHCGTPYPARENWDGWGFEYKSEATLFGWPMLHVSFKYRANRVPVPARGIVAIGQFACGVVTISQFGLGVFSISQFTIAGFAVAQFAIAYSLLAQFGIFVHQGAGQFVRSLSDLAHFFL